MKGSTAVRKFSGLHYCVEATGANVTVTVSQTLEISCKGWEAHHRALKPFLSLYRCSIIKNVDEVEKD